MLSRARWIVIERSILPAWRAFERANLQTAVGAVSRLNRISFGRTVPVWYNPLSCQSRINPNGKAGAGFGRVPTTQQVVYLARERAGGPWDVSINDVGLHAFAVNLPLAQADERSVPIIFRRNERDEQDHSSDPCRRCFSRSKLAGL
jgi:hypothetical protein